MNYKYIAFLAFYFLFIREAEAQYFTEPVYPQNYFIWPVDAKIGLSANFGELRPNHYHMGLDCRTDQKQNRPVLAAADGYIAKIKIEPSGFGRCLYINHPNGYTTLYAHLNDFNPAIEAYITAEQYRLKQWAIFIDVPPGMLPVLKGDYIALSGNTGGSQGPHLHFEIRNTKTDKVLNPSLFGFPLQDSIAPDVIRIAMYDRRISTYEQVPKVYSLKKINGVYSVTGGKIVTQSNLVSFALTAWDRYTGSTNQNGIYEAVIYADDKPISGFKIDGIGYDETRYLNGHIDYHTRSNGGPWLQHISPLPGYNNDVYVTKNNAGLIAVDSNASRHIKIEVRDAYGNTSSVAFELAGKDITIDPRPFSSNAPTYFMPGMVNVFEQDNIRFYLPANALYDAVHFKYSKSSNSVNPVHQLSNATIPVQTYFPVWIKGQFDIGDTGKIVMKRAYGPKQDFKKAVYEQGWYKASFREFGSYQLLLDRVPPVISSRSLINNMNAARLGSIIFTVTDNSEELSSFTALLDGNWLRFSNDKGRNFIYRFDERCAPGPHELKIIAEDQVGNVTQKVYNFTR